MEKGQDLREKPPGRTPPVRPLLLLPVESPQGDTLSASDLDAVWNVVVHNDPVNLMSYVTLVFRKVFGFPRERAEKHMLEVHHKGRSIVWTGPREPSEHYVQQLHSHLLLATLEKAPLP